MSSLAESAAAETKASTGSHLSVAEPVPSSLDVAQLLEEHGATIAELKALVAEDIPAGNSDGIVCQYDDIFFLRYVLSFGAAAECVAAVRATFKYRADPQNREMIQSLHDKSWEQGHLVKEMRKWQVAGPLRTGQKDGGVCVLIRGGLSDSPKLFDRLTLDEHKQAHLAYREGAFQDCDAKTRATGRLVKQALIFDMAGSKLSDMMDRRMSGIQTEVSNLSALLYPQLQSKMLLVNCPRWMTYVMAFFRRILPKRNMDKVALYADTQSFWASEWVSKHINREGVPSFLGGGLPDEELEPELTGALRCTSEPPQICISARDRKIVRVKCPSAGVCRFTVSVAARGVNFGAKLVHGSEGVDGCERPLGETTVLRQPTKIRAEAGPCKGSWTIQGPGVIEVELDNSYSVLRSKTVVYTFDFEM